MNEDHVAFHEIVTLLGWRDSSNMGPKVTFGLTSRASLEHFDKATRRRGKRAGQRYQASLAPVVTSEVRAALELWFAGANWAHQDGARVVFTVDTDGLDTFKYLTTKDSNHGTPSVLWLTLVQVDEDETAVNQRQADNVETILAPGGAGGGGIVDPDAEIKPPGPDHGGTVVITNPTGNEDPRPEPEKPKGGPHSKRAAMLCQEDEFQWYVSELEDRDGKSSVDECDAYLKRICGIESKVELDHSDRAYDTFTQSVLRPYIRWGGNAPRD